MASKPSVTMTLAGDEKKLTDAFDRVGAASKQMADRVESSSKQVDDAGKRFDDLGEKTDEAERRSMGFKDTLDGLTSGLSTLGDSSLSTTEKLMGLGQAGADLFGGITNFLLPTLQSLAGFLAGPLRAAMTFISSHPLLITIGLITAALIFLISQTDWFQQVATRVFNWVGNLAKNVFGAAIDWIKGLWSGLVDWFATLPDRIGRAFGSLGSAIVSAFKAGVNFFVDTINWFLDHTINWLIDRVNDVIRYVPGVPYLPRIPHIPRLHTGGIFHASGGGEGLALLKDGERVSAPGQGGGVELRVSGVGWFADLLNAAIRDGEVEAVAFR